MPYIQRGLRIEWLAIRSIRSWNPLTADSFERESLPWTGAGEHKCQAKVNVAIFAGRVCWLNLRAESASRLKPTGRERP